MWNKKHQKESKFKANAYQTILFKKIQIHLLAHIMYFDLPSKRHKYVRNKQFTHILILLPHEDDCYEVSPTFWSVILQLYTWITKGKKGDTRRVIGKTFTSLKQIEATIIARLQNQMCKHDLRLAKNQQAPIILKKKC